MLEQYNFQSRFYVKNKNVVINNFSILLFSTYVNIITTCFVKAPVRVSQVTFQTAVVRSVHPSLPPLPEETLKPPLWRGGGDATIKMFVRLQERVQTRHSVNDFNKKKQKHLWNICLHSPDHRSIHRSYRNIFHSNINIVLYLKSGFKILLLD